MDNKVIKKVILKIRSGSNLYGCSTPDSDKDYIGIFIPQDDYIVGLNKVEQLSENIISKNENGKNNKDAVDCTYYELRKFLNLCLNGNPNIFELLFVNEDNIVEITQEGRELLNLKEHFISEKVINNTIGFIKSMQKKLDTRQSSLLPLENLLNIIENLIKENNISSTEPISLLEKYEIFNNSVEKKKYNYIIGQYNIQRNATINNTINTLNNILECKTHRREFVKNFGYDIKSAYHIIRLYTQLIQLVEENTITYPLKNKDLMIDIKTGKVSFEDFIKLKNTLSNELEQLVQKNKLKSSANYKLVNEFCKQTLINNLGE